MQDKYILNIFQEGLIFGLDDCQFWQCRFTQICCAKGLELMNG